MAYELHCGDCMEWLAAQPDASVEAIVTDLPYGLKEYSSKERLWHTFDAEGADGAQGCCAWRDNRLVGRPKAELKGSLASSSVCGRRSH